MLELETSIQRVTKIESSTFRINDLLTILPGVGRNLGLEYARQILSRVQDRAVDEILAGRAELVCERCGVVHRGPATLLRRGSRARKLRTSSGVLDFALKQLTCRDCGRTWSPFVQVLGLLPRQRVSEELERKLVECVTDLSYQKTCDLAGAWLGAGVSSKTLHGFVQKRGERVRFTPAEPVKAVQADGTKVPAGPSERGTEVRFSLQILGRHKEHDRNVVEKRIAGWGIGPGSWSAALPPGIATEVIVSDREKGLPELLARIHPEVRHQHCEWHLGHTLDHLLYLDGVKVQTRKEHVATLGHIVWGDTADRRAAYAAFRDTLAHCPQAHTMLSDAMPNVLFEVPSAERTTSVIEREMREINRRTDVGVRWSVTGVANILRLRMAKRINQDDFDRVWSPVRTAAIHVVPHA